MQHDGKPASCLEDSFATYVTCTRCDYTTLKLIPAGHEPGSWTLTKEAACGVAGAEELRCKLCNEVLKTRAIAQLNHNFVVKSQKAATCTENGEIVYECSNCHATKTQVIIAGGHMFGDDNVCDVCDYTKVVHDHNYTTRVVAPTCTDMGYTVYTCSCGLSYKADYIDQKGHLWNDGAVKTAADCTKDGVMEYACKRAGCEATYEAAIPAAHDWNEDIITSATCTKDGEVLRACKKCDVKIREVIAAGHKWGNPVVITTATCTQEGLERVTCEVCGTTEDRAFVLGHEYKDGVCVRCGAKFIDEVTPHTDHLTYGVFFVIDDIVSNYGPATVNEYGAMLYINADAQLDKVAVYLTQDGYMWRRTIACTGTNIKFAVFVPYLSYNDQIYYSGLNSGWINTFSLTEGYDGIWRYSEYATIGANLEDKNGNLLLSLYDIGQAGSKTRVFDDLSAMKAWLKEGAVHKHKVVIDAAVEPTCTKVGYTEGSHCSICGEVIAAQNEIEALGHDFVWCPAKPATCTEVGWEEYQICAVCGETINTEEMPALGHDFVEHEAKEATCEMAGWDAYETCTRCDYTTYEELPARGHDFVEHPAKKPTCTEIGWDEYRTCSRCDYITKEELPALGHDFVEREEKEATCTEIGWDAYETCTRCDYTTYVEIVALGHDIVKHPEKEPTCTEIGWDVYVSCTRCDYTTKEEIPALGHDIVSIAAKSPTCTEDGWDKYITCTRCDFTTYVEMPALGHDYVDGICTRCGKTDQGTEDWTPTEGLKYVIDETGECCLIGIGTATAKDIVIAKEYNGLLVTSIDNSAFAGCSGLISITIPNSITYISGGAFQYCSGLESIVFEAGNATYHSKNNCIIETASKTLIAGFKNSVIPSDGSVTSIGNSAFYGCSGLTSITIPDSVISIGEDAFKNCSGLTSITIPDSVTSIGNSAFNGCRRLTSIIIPDSVTSIGRWTFGSCSGLTSVTIGNGITSIDDDYMFNSCYKLVEVINNSSLNITKGSSDYGGIGKYALNVKKGGSSEIVNKDGYLFYTYNGINYLLGYSGTETELTLPDSYNGQNYAIYKYAFEDCGELTSVTIGNGATSIGYRAFAYCSGLTNITIGNGVTSIGDMAFFKCHEITSIIIPDSLAYIGEEAFAECSVERIYITDIAAWCKIEGLGGLGAFLYINNELVTNLIIPNSVTSIGEYAFSGCSGLTSVTIGNSVTSIGDSAFSGCSGLNTIEIPNSVTKIENYAFYGCTSLTTVNYQGTAEEWSKITIDEGNECLTNAKINYAGVSIVGTEGLNYTLNSDQKSYSCAGIGTATAKDIVIAKVYNGLPVTAIGSSAFKNCSGLTSITIPDSVTSIGYRAFAYCSGLTSVTIGNSVTSIGQYAFENCSGLKFNEYDNGLYLGNETNPYVVLFNAKSEDITCCTINEKCKVIYDFAFKGCSGLTSITIPDSVTSIGEYAFDSCSGLTSITMPDSVTSIGQVAFYNCSGLISVTIGNSVTAISYRAFDGCSGLTNVTIGNSVTSIGQYAFNNCSGLTCITIPDSVISIGPSAFSNCSRLKFNEYDNGLYLGNETNPYVVLFNAKSKDIASCTIYEKSKVIYDFAFKGCSGLTSVTIGNSVTSIGQYAFENCSWLTSITIPDSVTSIGDYAFSGCSGLTSVTIGNGVTFIGNYMFYNCSRLASITIPDSITSIGYMAFFNCSGLTSITIPDSVTSIGSSAFYHCSRLTSITIPDSVTYIGGEAFYGCIGLESIEFEGTIAQWNAISKGSNWKYNVPSSCKVKCTDGEINI